MFGARRAITSLLVTQATTLVLTTGAAIAWTISEIQVWHSQVEVPNETVRIIEGHVQQAIIAPYDYLGTHNVNAKGKAQRSAAEARASLRVLGRLVPALESDVAEATSALNVLESASARLFDGHAVIDDSQLENTAPRSLTLLDQATAEMNRSMAKLTANLTNRSSSNQFTNQLGLLAMWSLAIGVYLITGVTARRRFRTNEQQKAQDLNHAIGGAVEALKAINEGEPIPAIPDHPLVEDFKVTVTDVATRLDDLHRTNRRIRRQFTFRHELVEALDLAESETEVIRTATRAARVAFPEKIFQLLVNNDDGTSIEVIEPSAPVACAVTCVESCPAARKGDVLYHHPDMGLSRCPRIVDEDTIVTCSPISVNGQAVAVVQLMGTPLDDGQEELLEALSTAVGVRTGVVRNLAERELAAGTDPLTELANRRAMDEHLRRLDGAEVPYTVIVADLDHFKRINDTHGHETGDRCLQIFADILKEACRDTDIACRAGGEEFSLILSGAGIDAGMAVASRIRAMLHQESRRQGPPFTTSLGIAARPNHGDRAEEILRAADVALYDAKDQGRDRCVVAEVPMSLEVVGLQRADVS
ncbi:MAG: diguanylate cyclase [Myxococcota bacterium]